MSLLARWLFAVYSYFFALLWGISRQIVTVVIGHYWKLFPLSWKYYPPPSASGSISNFGETISNSDLNNRHYLYNNKNHYQQVGMHWSLNGYSIPARSVFGRVKGKSPWSTQSGHSSVPCTMSTSESWEVNRHTMQCIGRPHIHGLAA